MKVIVEMDIEFDNLPDDFYLNKSTKEELVEDWLLDVADEYTNTSLSVNRVEVLDER